VVFARQEYYGAGFLGLSHLPKSQKHPACFALIGTWTSTDSMAAARRAPAFRVLEQFQAQFDHFDDRLWRLSSSGGEYRRRGKPGGVHIGRTRSSPHNTVHDSTEVRCNCQPRFLVSLVRGSNEWRLFHEVSDLFALSQSHCSAPVFLSGCRSTGAEFLGKWVNKASPSDSFQVVRNGVRIPDRQPVRKNRRHI